MKPWLFCQALISWRWGLPHITRRWNPKVEFVIVYNACRDTEPQNQRRSEAKARGVGRKSTSPTVTLKSKGAPANWLERTAVSISEFVKLFSSQRKGNICSTGLILFWVTWSPCVLVRLGEPRKDSMWAAEPGIQFSDNTPPQLASPRGVLPAGRPGWVAKLGNTVCLLTGRQARIPTQEICHQVRYNIYWASTMWPSPILQLTCIMIFSFNPHNESETRGWWLALNTQVKDEGLKPRSHWFQSSSSLHCIILVWWCKKMLGEARQYFSASKMECEGDFQVVQWLRLHASNAGVWSLEGELRSYKLQGVAKKKRRRRRRKKYG